LVMRPIGHSTMAGVVYVVSFMPARPPRREVALPLRAHG
jgi:hypothetical protein